MSEANNKEYTISWSLSTQMQLCLKIYFGGGDVQHFFLLGQMLGFYNQWSCGAVATVPIAQEKKKRKKWKEGGSVACHVLIR